MSWRKCVSFPDYEVSSDGQVRRAVVVRGRTPGIIRPFIDRGYPAFKLRRGGRAVKAYLHRLVGEAFHGLTPDGEIDHRFHDLEDISQIRVATRTENARNTRGKRKRSSRFKGVSWARGRNKWCACIRIDGKTRSLGRFADEISAARAYDAAASAAWGEFAFLNLPQGDQ